MHQILHNRCPSYLTDLVEFTTADSQRRQLRSSLTRADVVQRTMTHFGKRASSVCGPHTWNSLPPAVRNIDSYLAFRRALRSHLFHLLLPPINFYFIFYIYVVRTLPLLTIVMHSRPFCMTGLYNIFYHFYHLSK